MDPFNDLKLQARLKRDRAMADVQSEYVGTLCEISRLARRMAQRRPRGRPRSVGCNQSYAAMTVVMAAESILKEGTPLTLVELTLEVQARGCRTGDNPRAVAHAIRGAFYYHRNRFQRDAKLRWSLVAEA